MSSQFITLSCPELLSRHSLKIDAMNAIQSRNLIGQSRNDGHISITWSLLDSDPPDPTFFLEHMVNGTWRFSTDVVTVDPTTFEVTIEAEVPQQFRIIATDGSPSETVIVDPPE
jgi:hypothetical protein